MDNIFTYEPQDIDLKESIKLRINCQQSDTVVLQFNVYNYDIPVDLTNFNVELVGVKSDGTLYRQSDYIIKSSNQLTISCDKQLTASIGKTQMEIRIYDNLNNQKSSYFILLNVSGLVSNDDRNVSRNFVDILERFDDDINIALKLSEVFKEDINTANELELAFQSSINIANQAEANFEQTIENANENKIILDNTIENANSINNTLTDKNAESNLLIPRVTSINDTAQITKANLQNLIDTSETKLQEFKDFDTNQIVVKTNEMYNEMFAINELLIIEHNLDATPVVQFIIVNEGYGIGGYGQTSYGGVSECGFGTYKVRYYSKNKLSIVVSNNYYKENPIITKVNDYEYSISFENYSKTMLIKLLVVDNNSYLIDDNGNFIIDELGRYLIG